MSLGKADYDVTGLGVSTYYAEEISKRKAYQMFSVHTTPEEFQKRNNHRDRSAILDLCLRNIRSGKSRDYRDVIVFEKLRFQNVFSPQENEKTACSNSFGLKSVCEKHCFCDRLVWTAGLTVEIKLRSKISPA